MCRLIAVQFHLVRRLPPGGVVGADLTRQAVFGRTDAERVLPMLEPDGNAVVLGSGRSRPMTAASLLVVCNVLRLKRLNPEVEMSGASRGEAE